MRRGVVTKKVCPGFQVWEMPKRAFNNGTLTIKAYPIKIKIKIRTSQGEHGSTAGVVLVGGEHGAVFVNHFDNEGPTPRRLLLHERAATTCDGIDAVRPSQQR